MAKSTEELLRARFDDLSAQLDTHDSNNAPLRQQIDALQAQKAAIDEDLAPLVQQWVVASEKRQELQNEIGKVARGLGGRSTSDVR